MLRAFLSRASDDPKVMRMLTREDTEAILERVIERIVDEVVKREAELGRELTFKEFREHMMKTLDKVVPEVTSYIV